MNVTELDLYDILGVQQDDDYDIIRKAYRKKALKCHPDKNPDNPHAAAQWEKLAKALEILSDKDARAAYDKVLKAKKAAELRNKALEGKRRKIKEELESREASFKKEQESSTKDINSLEEKIQRLREEGSQTLQREQELLKKELDSNSTVEEDDTSPKLKIKWKAQKGDTLNGGYDYAFLKQIFGKYGQVTNLILSKRNGSAIIEFSSADAAEIAVSNEFGLPRNPLQLIWLSGKPEKKPQEHAQMGSSFNNTDQNFEDDVLQLLLQAEAMKQQGKTHEQSNTEQCSERSETKGVKFVERYPPPSSDVQEGEDG